MYMLEHYRLKLVIMLSAVFFSGFLILAPYQQSIPDPTSAHTGFVAGAFGYIADVSRLGSIDLDILEQAQALQTNEPEAFFWPNNLGDYLSPGESDSREFIASPQPSVELLYVVAFAMFGPSLSSVVALWAILLVLGVILGLSLPLSRPNVHALGLILGFLILTISAVPFLDVQSLSVVNFRLLPLLVVFPITSLVMALMNRKPFPIWGVPVGVVVGAFLGFIVVGRQTALWGVLAMLIAGLVSLSSRRRPGHFRSLAVILVLMVAPVASIQTFSRTIAPTEPLESSYNDSLDPTNTMRWFSVAVGLYADPRLYEKYVCNMEPPKTAPNIDRLPCSGENFSPLRALIAASDPRNPYSDLAGYNAAIKHIEERNLELDLALPPARMYPNLTQFNMDWGVLGQVSMEITVEMLRKETGVVLQNFLIAKPVRLLLVLAIQPYMVAKSLTQAALPILLLVPLALIVTVFLFSLRDILRSRRKAECSDDLENDLGKRTGWALSLLSACSIVPAMVFYSQSHTVLDIGIFIAGLGAFLLLKSFGMPKNWTQ